MGCCTAGRQFERSNARLSSYNQEVQATTVMGAGYENQRTTKRAPSTNRGVTSLRIKGVFLEIFGTLKISLEVLLILVVCIKFLFALVKIFILRVKSRNECASPSSMLQRRLRNPGI